MDEDFTIALCIPAYKAEKCLPLLLESAFNQTVQFDEIIVCVDACPGNTAAVAKNYPVKVVENGSNLGCSATKNRALKEVKSKWVHFHDADDILLPEFVEVARAFVYQRRYLDVIIMGYEYRDYTTGELILTSNYDTEGLESDPLLYCIENKIPNFGVYKTETLRSAMGFNCDKRVLYSEDVAFHYKLARLGFRFSACNRITSVNWRHPNSMSVANQRKCFVAYSQVYRNIAEECGKKYPEQIARKLIDCARLLAGVKEFQQMHECIKIARNLNKDCLKDENSTVRLLSRLFSPSVAFFAREIAIRLLKPQYRTIK